MIYHIDILLNFEPGSLCIVLYCIWFAMMRRITSNPMYIMLFLDACIRLLSERNNISCLPRTQSEWIIRFSNAVANSKRRCLCLSFFVLESNIQKMYSIQHSLALVQNTNSEAADLYAHYYSFKCLIGQRKLYDVGMGQQMKCWLLSCSNCVRTWKHCNNNFWHRIWIGHEFMSSFS